MQYFVTMITFRKIFFTNIFEECIIFIGPDSVGVYSLFVSFVCLFVCLFVIESGSIVFLFRLSVCLFVIESGSIVFLFRLSVCLFVCLSVCLSHLFLSHALTQKLFLWSVSQVCPTNEAYKFLIKI